jgi:hypothetical protein
VFLRRDLRQGADYHAQTPLDNAPIASPKNLSERCFVASCKNLSQIADQKGMLFEFMYAAVLVRP